MNLSVPRRARRALSLLTALGVLAGAGLGLTAPPAHAATTRATTCVDGSGVRWDVAVRWGATAVTASGERRVALDSAAWTTTRAGATPTDSRVRTYDGAGRLLQDLRWSGTVAYGGGATWRSRNPVNPVSSPGRAKVVLTLGVDGDGRGDCSVTVTQPGSTPSAADRYEADVVAATNRERATGKVGALSPQACVDRYAEAQAQRMAAEQLMHHQELAPVLEGCDLRTVGENVALGFSSGAAVTAAWMDSPGHRANILRPGYRLIGVGAAQGADGAWYAAQVFGTAR